MLFLVLYGFVFSAALVGAAPQWPGPYGLNHPPGLVHQYNIYHGPNFHHVPPPGPYRGPYHQMHQVPQHGVEFGEDTDEFIINERGKPAKQQEQVFDQYSFGQQIDMGLPISQQQQEFGNLGIEQYGQQQQAGFVQQPNFNDQQELEQLGQQNNDFSQQQQQQEFNGQQELEQLGQQKDDFSQQQQQQEFNGQQELEQLRQQKDDFSQQQQQQEFNGQQELEQLRQQNDDFSQQQQQQEFNGHLELEQLGQQKDDFSQQQQQQQEFNGHLELEQLGQQKDDFSQQQQQQQEFNGQQELEQLSQQQSEIFSQQQEDVAQQIDGEQVTVPPMTDEQHRLLLQGFEWRLHGSNNLPTEESTKPRQETVVASTEEQLVEVIDEPTTKKPFWSRVWGKVKDKTTNVYHKARDQLG